MSHLSQYVEKWLAGNLELAPITALLAVRPISLDQGEAKIEMTVGERLHNAMGTVHGGILCTPFDKAIAHKMCFDGFDSAFYARIIGRKKTYERHHEKAGVQIPGSLILNKRRLRQNPSGKPAHGCRVSTFSIAGCLSRSGPVLPI